MDKKERLCKMQAQLDEWVADLDQLRNKAETAGSEALKKLPDQVRILEKKIEDGAARIKELADLNEEAFKALSDGFDSAWDSLVSGFNEAKAKFTWDKDKN